MAGFVLAGAALRLWNLRDQVMGGDELHAVRAVASRTASEILTQYSLVDYSLPITAGHRLLLDLGAHLSEIHFRLPALLCGLLALIVMPRAFSGRLESFSVELFGWLLALSPAFVLYSRIARSYMPMVLLAFAAAVSFERWWETGAKRAGLLYVLFAALAVWVHLGAAPFVAAPFLFAFGDLVRTRAWPRLRELALLGLALALAMAAYLVPAAPSLLRLIGDKRQQEVRIPQRTLGAVLRLEAGARSWPVTLLFWAAALIGLVLLLRRHPRLGWFSLTVAGGHAAGILLLSPFGISHPIVLNRYLLPALPFVLLWVAFAVGGLWNPRRPLGRSLQRSAAYVLLLLLFWMGPFLTPDYLSSSFMHHNDFVGFSSPLSSLPGELVPAIYRRLPDGPVVEYPWSTVWEENRTFYVYQLLHKQRVLVSAPFGVPHGGIDLRNEVEPEPAAFLASRARIVIVHLRQTVEESLVVIPARRRLAKRNPPILRRYYRRVGEKLASRLAAEWGPADYSDRQVQAWDLDRLRGRGQR